MLEIIKPHIDYELNFNGIKVLQTPNPTKTYKDLFIDSAISIDGMSVKADDIIYINELSKLSDFINLNKKSFLMKEIIDLLDQYPIVNTNNVEQISTAINAKYNEQLLDTSTGDVSKVISLFIEFVNSSYLNMKLFEIVLTMFETKKLFVFDNVSWLQLGQLTKYLNEHNFIILTNDFCDVINDPKMLELLVIIKPNYDFSEILDIEKLYIYLEQQLNTKIDDAIIQTWMRDKHNDLALKFMSKMLQI